MVMQMNRNMPCQLTPLLQRRLKPPGAPCTILLRLSVVLGLGLSGLLLWDGCGMRGCVSCYSDTSIDELGVCEELSMIRLEIEVVGLRWIV